MMDLGGRHWTIWENPLGPVLRTGVTNVPRRDLDQDLYTAVSGDKLTTTPTGAPIKPHQSALCYKTSCCG